MISADLNARALLTSKYRPGLAVGREVTDNAAADRMTDAVRLEAKAVKDRLMEAWGPSRVESPGDYIGCSQAIVFSPTSAEGAAQLPFWAS